MAGLTQWIDEQPGPGWLMERRREAAALDAGMRLPRWDRTDISALNLSAYAPPAGSAVEVRLPEEAAGTGIICGTLDEVAAREPELVQRYLGAVVPAAVGKFEARNLAAHQGCLLYVPDRVTLRAPIEIIYRLGSGASAQFHPRTVIALGRTAEIDVVQRLEGGPLRPAQHAAAGVDGGGALVTEVVEARLDPGARLRLVDLQAWGEGVQAFASRRAELDRDATVHWLIAELGSGLTRSATATSLRGEGSEARSLLVFFGSGTQHMDMLATLQHWGRRTDGLMLAKGVLKDRARAVYRGTSDIKHAAKGSNSQQKENVLHLSPGVRSDAIPALYIDESELQAGHAATTGKLDPEQLFYMHARGLPQREAERLIIHGFFAPILERIPLPGPQAALAELIDRKLDGSGMA